jgi:hypothetical protein
MAVALLIFAVARMFMEARLMRIFATVFVAVLWAVPAYADRTESYFLTGEYVWETCDATDSESQAHCQGIIMGLIDGLELDDRICKPISTNALQARDVVLDHLRENPKSRYLPAVEILLVALNAAWPCP